jgi:hypothetical protein
MGKTVVAENRPQVAGGGMHEDIDLKRAKGSFRDDGNVLQFHCRRVT